MTTDELDYLKQEAADYERHELTEDEQDEVDAEAMQANVQAWNGAKVDVCRECGENPKEENSNWCYECMRDFVNTNCGDY